MEGKQLSMYGGSVGAAHPYGCRIVAVGKRRDGGTRYWCLAHRANATAKYGRESEHCRHALIPPLGGDEVIDIVLSEFPGGVALWGAVPPVYDTTDRPLDRGIHIHARKRPGEEKDIDATSREVRVVSGKGTHVVNELDAIYYMVSQVLGFTVRSVTCTLCGYPHLDKDWFAVHPHQRHLCAGCGRTFRDTRRSIGNPIAELMHICEMPDHRVVPATAMIEFCQSKYRGGIQIWGSNSAMLWSSSKPEHEGIHIHAFRKPGDTQPEIDETFASVVIDGVELDPAPIRRLMAQMALPHLSGRIVGMVCPRCSAPCSSDNEDAFTPKVEHTCRTCGSICRNSGRLRLVIANPAILALADLERGTNRRRQTHLLNLLPETM